MLPASILTFTGAFILSVFAFFVVGHLDDLLRRVAADVRRRGGPERPQEKS